MNDYDKRQYALMIRSIEEFKKENLSANGLIGNLEALLVCLQEPDPNWKKLFRQEWAIIEDNYAVMRSEERSEFSLEEKRMVEKAIEKIQALLVQIGFS